MKTAIKAFAKFILGMVLFIGLPLIGWGIYHTSEFLSNSARLSYVLLITVSQLLLIIFYPDIGQNRGKGKDTVKRQHYILIMLQIIPVLVLLLSPFCDRRDSLVIGEWNFIRYAGLIIFAAGFYLMNRAEIVLDKQFSVEVTIQENHRLITNGPFRYIRHPRYLGIILFMTGISLIFRSGLGLILVLILLLVLLWRIRDEELFMHIHFGAQWEDYGGRTKKLIPFIY